MRVRLEVTGPPVDVDARAASRSLAGDFVAEDEGEIVGSIHVHASGHGFGEIGMMVRQDRRGRGVGTALMAAAIAWASRRLAIQHMPHAASRISAPATTPRDNNQSGVSQMVSLDIVRSGG